MKVVWTELAKFKLKETFQYYKEVAGVKVATSIKSKIFAKVRKLSRFPEIGQLETNPVVAAMDYRYLVSGNDKIVYRIIREQGMILIVAIFDTRQDPDQLEV